ncbi:MAG: hypothetical protein MJZ57_08130 [Bacteroidales bacterium]|nr:hypothetical protein [Bacteroidales bacterium]
MKKTLNYCASIVLLLVVVLTGCQKFDPATVEITSCITDGRTMYGTARITDNGGCSYFIEQGYCYSLFDTVSATEIYTTMVPVNYSTDSLTFSWTEELPMADTIYYVKAYVKTNAGIAYSKTERVSTLINTSK